MDPWKFEVNTFEAVTRGTFKLTDILLRDHVARLVKCLAKVPGDADFVAMYGRAASVLSMWQGVYLPYRVARGVYKARTQTVYDMLAEIPDRLADWDIDIQAAGGPTRPFKAGKPAYTELFPQGRAPFTSGALEMRLAALEALVLAMAPYSSALGAVQTSVQAFTSALVAARAAQQAEEGGTEANSSAVETARLAVCDAMFRNLGRAMEKYGASDMIGKFFDLSYVRDGATPPPEGAPEAPLNLALLAAGADGVSASWDAVPEVEGYRLYRRLPGETAWTLVQDNVEASPALVTGQPAGVLMEWAVTAFNEAGESARSVPEEITL